MKQSDLLNQLYKISGSTTKKDFASSVNYEYTNLAKRFKDINSMKVLDLTTWCKVFDQNLLFNHKPIQDQNQLIQELIAAAKVENLNQLSVKIQTNYNELYLYKTNKRKLSLIKFLTWTNQLNVNPEIKPINNG